MMASASKKVLVISYLYPPSQEVGALRISEFVKYLPQFDWQPIVVTSRDGWLTGTLDPKIVYRTNPTFFERLIIWFRQSGRRIGPYAFSKETGFIQSSTPFGQAIGRIMVVWLRGWWSLKAIPLAYRVAKQNQIDLIYVNCGPFGPTLTGVILRLIIRRPLIFDFRDAWSFDPYGQFSWVGHVWARLWEWLIFHLTDGLIVTSPSAQHTYETTYRKLRGKTHCITNGVDETLFADIPKTSLYPKSAVGYAGTIYVARLDSFLRILAKQPQVKLHLFGRIFAPDLFWSTIESYQLKKQIIYHGFLLRHELFRELMRCHLLLLTQDYHVRGTVSPIAGKTFEYLTLPRPILALVPPGDNAKILSDQPGTWVVTHDTPKTIHQYLQAALESPPVTRDTSRYSRRGLAQTLASVLTSISDGRLKIRIVG